MYKDLTVMALTTSLQRPEPTLVTSKPTKAAPSSLKIAHVQLRNLVVCPKDPGVVWYVSDGLIVEQDVRAENSVPHLLAQTVFTPVCLDAICLDDGNVLLVAGGQEAELFLGLYSFMSKTITIPNNVEGSSSNTNRTYKSSEEIWKHVTVLPGSINNSVMLYVPPIPALTTREYFDQCEVPFTKPNPRFVVSNNDCSVKIFEVCTSREGFGRRSVIQARSGRWRREEPFDRFQRIGAIKLTVPINHTSISPDGSTLLSCGDSSTVHLHRISPWAPGIPMKFEHIASYMLPQPTIDNSSFITTPPISPYLPYAFVDGQWTVGGGPSCSCFSTAWNSDGSKFAVASQEGMVVVWDVRSGEPLPKARWETSRRDMKRPEVPPQSHLLQLSPQTHPHLFPSMAMGVMDEREFDRAAATFAAAAAAASQDLPSQPMYTPDPWVLVDSSVHAPAWGVRNVKFSKNVSGQEVLVFTEHASFVHVIDADTFEKHDVIRIPHIRPSATSMSAQHAMDPDQAFHAALAVEQRRLTGSPFDAASLAAFQRHRNVQQHTIYPGREVPSASSTTVPYPYLGVPRVFSPTNPLTRSPEPMMSSEFGQDGLRNVRTAAWQSLREGGRGLSSTSAEGGSIFRRDGTQTRPFAPRVPRVTRVGRGGPSSARGPQPYITPSGSALADDDAAHVVEMPSFENEGAEAGIRETLSAHGITVLPPRRRRRLDGPVLLLESSSEPLGSVPEQQESGPSQGPAASSSGSSISINTETATQMSEDDADIAIEVDDSLSDDNECSTPPIIPPPPLPSTTSVVAASPTSPTPSTPSPSPPAVQSLPPCQDLIDLLESTDRLDIGGVAFDPSGSCMYVATVDGISEWTIKGSTTRWWSKGGWL